MKMKKSNESNLENKRKSLLTMGLLVASCLTLCSFEWANFQSTAATKFNYTDEVVLDDIIIQTFRAKSPKKKVQVKKQKINLIAEIIEGQADEPEIDFPEIDMDDEPILDEPELGAEIVDEEEIFVVVEEAPEFPGGEAEMRKFLQANLDYPQLALDAGIQGTVYLTFVVDKSGAISGIELLRGIGGGCDKEAIDVIEKMPKWKPGKQRGNPVNVQFNMPIKFKTR